MSPAGANDGDYSWGTPKNDVFRTNGDYSWGAPAFGANIPVAR
ncbi:hypothetical protein [Micromonospora musae]